MFNLGLGLSALVIGVSPGPSSQASGGRCATDALRVVSFGGQGAAGTDFAFLRFELRRAGECTLSGYPGVTLLDGRRPYRLHVGRYLAQHPRTVHVRTDRPAYFGLVLRGARSTSGRPLCHGRITSLRVTPPNDRQALAVKLRPALGDVCLRSVQVEAVRSSRVP